MLHHNFFTRLVIGDDNAAMVVLQSMNHNDMCFFFAEQQQTISSDIIFEYNGEDYFAIYVVDNVSSVESECGHRIITVDASLYTIIN